MKAYFGQMRYRVNDENIVVRQSSHLRGVPRGQREALYKLFPPTQNNLGTILTPISSLIPISPVSCLLSPVSYPY